MQVAVSEHSDHVGDVFPMESRCDCNPAGAPDFAIGGDETRAHHKVQDFC